MLVPFEVKNLFTSISLKKALETTYKMIYKPRVSEKQKENLKKLLKTITDNISCHLYIKMLDENLLKDHNKVNISMDLL